MKKQMKKMLLGVGLLFGSIFIYKGIGILRMIMSPFKMPPATVSAMKVGYSQWYPRLDATGSVRAVRGVNVTTEVAGMIDTVYFTPGATVKAGDPLLQLNADVDNAQLHSLQANAELAQVTYARNKAQFAAKAISKAVLDSDEADLKAKKALVSQQQAVVAKKTIRAPFAGRLGISAVNPGQYLTPGEKIVTLQELNPIYLDFYVPQQAVKKIKTGEKVRVITDSFADKSFKGLITTVNPEVDTTTRNIQVEATVANPDGLLLPGMFASVKIVTGEPKRFLTLPQTAVTFNPYGEIVFVISSDNKDPKQKEKTLIANPIFVTIGKTRGDQVSILSGIKEGEMVVTSGQLKLKKGMPVVIDNSVVPNNNPAPQVQDE